MSSAVARSPRPQQLNFRATDRQADLLRRAAAATDQTVTDFVVERIRWDELIELLDAPLPSTTRLRALKARRDPFTDDEA
jgi:uncharacterized protein (DUF1778 family)